MILSSSFWPVFWVLVGGGTALAAVLALLASGIPAPRRHRQPAALTAEPTEISSKTPSDDEAAAAPLRAA